MGFGVQFAFLLLCILQQGQVDSYPNSVQESPDVCSKMIPGHGPRPQQTTAPFRIILNKQEVSGGNKLEITIAGRKGATFKGFYIQVRDEDGKPFGTFLVPDAKEAGTHNCFKRKNNAVHHKNNSAKKLITVYWKAPEDYEGQAKVMATILKDFETYWTNVQAPEPVSVSSSSSKIFFPSNGILEKETQEPSEYAKTARILNYNPYSPITQVSPWDSTTRTNDSSELLASQPSEDSNAVLRERQLFGPTNFDFHGGFFPSKLPSLHKGTYPLGQSVPIQDPFVPSSPNFPASTHSTGAYPPPLPPASILDKLGPPKTEIEERNPLNSGVNGFTLGYPQVSTPYPFYSPKPLGDHNKNSIYQTPPPLKFKDHSFPPLNQFPPHSSPDKGSHYPINYYPHYPPKPLEIFNPHHQHYLPHHKPASDPAYPNSGYFPKDILTKLTSYIPNIYNALTNNPLFNFNVDNTIESIWRPSKGLPPKQDALSSVTTPTKIEMPKYGYLIYNPVRGDPFFVIPAANEEEFVANHLGRARDGVIRPQSYT